VEVLLTDALKWKLWWDGDNGDLTEQMEGKGRKGAGVQVGSHGRPAGRVVACWACLRKGWSAAGT
jgi:hypothetical protein